MSRRIKIKHTKVDIAQTLGAAVAISAISNAAEAVASVTSTAGLAVGEFVVLDSKWSGARHKVVRIKAVVENVSVTLEGFNTTDTVKFPIGGGAGSLRKIVSWARFGDLKSYDRSGGETKFIDGTTIDDDTDVEVPNGRSASRLTLVVYDDADDEMPALVEAAERGELPVPLRIVAGVGVQTVASACWALGDAKKDGDWSVRQIVAAFACREQRYVS